MLSYCLKRRKNIESKNLKSLKRNKRKLMFSSECAVCDSTKLKFTKKEELSGDLGSLIKNEFLPLTLPFSIITNT